MRAVRLPVAPGRPVPRAAPGHRVLPHGGCPPWLFPSTPPSRPPWPLAPNGRPASKLPARGDALALRALINAGFPASFAGLAATPDVSWTGYQATAEDGAAIELRWYTRAGAQPGSAVAYIHGGGMICGTIDYYDPLVRQYVQWTGVPFLSVEYRLAPEHPGETPARDSLAGLSLAG